MDVGLYFTSSLVMSHAVRVVDFLFKKEFTGVVLSFFITSELFGVAF